MNSNLCPLAVCRLYSPQNNLKKALNKYSLEEESNRDASACAPIAQLQGFDVSHRCLGSTVHPQHRGKSLSLQV
jgi:hypothetical protein